jgi:hypothetical protein
VIVKEKCQSCMGKQCRDLGKARHVPVGPRTGWFPPWCPNFILNVSPPNACPSTWWPMQMPNTGTLPRIALAFCTAYGTAEGSPGPFENKTPSGFCGWEKNECQSSRDLYE